MKIIFTIYIFVFAINLFAQNLVPNPSFEDTVYCPFGAGQFDAIANWTSFGGSPDYNNGCAPIASVSVPYNQYGFQPDGSFGQGYFGIYVYDAFIDSSYHYSREAIGAALSTALSIGQKYFVSFKANFILKFGVSDVACNKLGAVFTTFPYDFTLFASDPSLSAPINNFAHVFTDSVISDTSNWTRIQGSFIADSSYQYISIGNFFRNTITDTITYDLGVYTGASYYFIDDVCVSTDSIYALNYDFNGVDENNFLYHLFELFPNPANDIIIIETQQPKGYIKLCSITGSLIKQVIVNSARTEIDMHELPNGVYFVQWGSTTKKLIVQH